ncbi:MAG: transcriptional repressor [Sphingobacteriia bacterium]|nr:MAG: transcriptional repressor [Sphingobacteriia bacterium]
MTREKDINQMLKDHGLSSTETRRTILGFFHAADKALAHADIETMGTVPLDRVTIYRTLQSFVEKGLLHSIPSADNAVRYALCKDHCADGHHHDNHVHFMCDQCSRTYCLDEITIPRIKLPLGFTACQTDLVVSGVCKTCQS